VHQVTSAGGFDGFVWKLNSAGDFVWARQFGGSGDDAVVFNLKLDSSGNIYAPGMFSGTVDFDPGPGTYQLTSAGAADTVVLKLDGQGSLIWARRMGGSTNDVPSGITLDDQQNVLVNGYFNDGVSQPVDFDPGPGVSNLSGLNQAFVWK